MIDQARQTGTPPATSSTSNDGIADIDPLSAWRRHGVATSDLVEQTAATLRSMSCREDPVHLHSIARALGVQRIIVDQSLDRHGQLVWQDDRPVIRLRSGLSTARRRFTLAHELAHTALGHGGPMDSGDHSPVRLRADERLADAVAGACLVSPAIIGAVLGHQVITLGDVRTAAEQQQVSLSVLVNQLAHRTVRAPVLLTMRWDQRQCRWSTQRMAGGNQGMPPLLTMDRADHRTVEAWPRDDVEVRFRAHIGSYRYELSGTGNRRSDSALVLIDRFHLLGRSEAGS